MLQQFNILIMVAGFSITSTKLFITSQRFLTIKHEGKETNKKDQTKMYTNLATNFLFYLICKGFGIKYKEREKMEKQSDFHFLFIATFSPWASSSLHQGFYF